MWKLLKREYDTILLVVFIGVCVWKPFIFIATAVGLGSLLFLGFGLMFIQNAFRPWIGKTSFDGGLTTVGGRIYSFLFGIFLVGIAVGLFLFICGGKFGEIGQKLFYVLRVLKSILLLDD